MAFDGELIYVSSNNTGLSWTALPLKYIKAESYSALLSGQDVGSYRDSNGILHRQALQNVIPKVEFSTKQLVTNKDVKKIMNIISGNYLNETEKSIYVKAYIPEIDDYVVQKCYVPDITFVMNMIDKENNVIKYNSTRIAFIGYGGRKR